MIPEDVSVAFNVTARDFALYTPNVMLSKITSTKLLSYSTESAEGAFVSILISETTIASVMKPSLFFK